MLWILIRIRFHLAALDPDPDPYWECGSGSGYGSMEIYQNLQINLVSCLSKRLRYLRKYIRYLKYIFHVKIQLSMSL
jgi:hypothetical protein